MATEWTQWYPHEIDAWQGSASIQTFSDAAYRAYHNLIMVQFQQPNGKLIDDDALLAKHSRMGARWMMFRKGMPTIAEEVRAALTADAEGFVYSPKQFSKWERAHAKHAAYVDRLEAARLAKMAKSARETELPISINRPIDRDVGRAINTPVDSSDNSSIPRAERERESKKESKRNTKDSGAESSSAPPPVATLPLVSGEEFPVSLDQLHAWEKAFPAVDVENHIQRMKVWLHENPERMKTRKGIGRFAITWLSREQDKPQGGGGYGTSNRNQQRTNGNIEAARSAAASISAEILDWHGGGKASVRERGDVEALFSSA